MLDCARQLGNAVRCYQAAESAARYREHGRLTAARYTDGEMRRALADYWGGSQGDDQSE